MYTCNHLLNLIWTHFERICLDYITLPRFLCFILNIDNVRQLHTSFFANTELSAYCSLLPYLKGIEIKKRRNLILIVDLVVVWFKRHTDIHEKDVMLSVRCCTKKMLYIFVICFRWCIFITSLRCHLLLWMSRWLICWKLSNANNWYDWVVFRLLNKESSLYSKCLSFI